jgi:hypothetical protein
MNKTEPNQSLLQTMTAAVTDRAAHAPRQLRSCLIQNVRQKMIFRSTNTAWSHAGMFLLAFGLLFTWLGFVVGSMLPTETRYHWPGIFHLAFSVAGISIIGFWLYVSAKKWEYYTELSLDSLEWGRADLNRRDGLIQTRDIQAILYIIEDDFKIAIFDKDGNPKEIDGTYFGSNKEADKFVSVIRENFPDIKVSRK